ncbi:fibrinogen-like protein 1 [Anopheles coustani]|uniref:fibrinogen-like protein 1 n=1 Tax=Anopheles coustani TaxID=139045 RepID=UPI00265AE3EA|nr:fibrinogen-like protein 1 [Anopheles coustani]
MEQRLQEKLNKQENSIETIEVKMHAMEDSLKKSVKTNEENTRSKLEELSQTGLKKLRENKEILDMLTSSIHNLTTNVETRITGESGTYLFRLWEKSKPFEVFCEQNKFEGGWIVIQHRFDGSVDFYRNWTEYRNGFGNVDGEFWLGLEYVHQITKNRPHELLVEMKDFHGNYKYAKYDEFEIGNESELYVLRKLGRYSGTAGDALRSNKNKKFSTFDRDNDKSKDGNCAKDFHAAWWYNYCIHSNLNGPYQNTTGDLRAMVWINLKDDWRSMSYSRMMILLSARLTMAIGGFVMELLMTKLDYLQDKLQEVEQTMKSSLKVNLNSQHKLSENTMIKKKNIDSLFGGGWIVIQHRFDGSVDFYRNWTEYRNGFGNAMDINAEFWLGLENVHHITKNRPLELLVELKDFYGNYKFAKYDGFEIGSESEKYALKKLGKYIGIAGDAMGIHLNQKFSTFDRDNDVDNRNCAKEFHGAWWYVNCHRSNLNGRYQNTQNDGSAMMWYYFKNDLRGLSYSRMMIRAYIN